MASTTLYFVLLSTSLLCWVNANKVRVEFNVVDRSVLEGVGPCNVAVVKYGHQLGDITVRMRSLTIEQYQDLTGNAFTLDVNPAEVNDFKSTELNITFEQTGYVNQVVKVEVPVVDDSIHEENEVFLLFLDIVDHHTGDTVVARPKRNPLRCEIRNDDIINVGFERSSYTIPEGSSLMNHVYLVKPNGQATEEDITITVTAISLTSTLGEDFITSNGERRFSFTFPAGQDRIGIPIDVPSNDVAEGSRDFRLVFSASGVSSLKNNLAKITIEDTTTPSPPSSSPSNSPAPTTQCNMHNGNCNQQNDKVRVEFNVVDRSVLEGAGPCNVAVVKYGHQLGDITVRMRSLTIEQYQDLTGNVFTLDVNPAEVNDFKSTELNITFEQTGYVNQVVKVEVPVVDDSIHEENEVFLLFLDIVDHHTGDTVVARPKRNPLRCEIRNDDVINVGFERSSYTIPEGSSLMNHVYLVKPNGQATEEDITITVTAISLTSTLGEDFITSNGERRFSFTFPAGQDRIGIPIDVPSNDVAEGSRDFRLVFSASGVSSLKNNLAKITIEDTTTPSPPSSAPSNSPAPTTQCNMHNGNCNQQNDKVRVEFNVVDRSVLEGAGPCNIAVVKYGHQLGDITVRMRSLTIEQYQDLTGNVFTLDVNPAEVNDFKSTELNITFEQTGYVNQVVMVEVPVVDDSIHEENEVFLLFLDIVDHHTGDTVVARPKRNPLRCEIRNDDIINVGFERSSYTIPEGSSLMNHVYLVKPNGQATEEDITITVTAISLTSTLDEDFITSNGERRFSFTFPAGQDRIGIPIDVPSNDVAEGSRDFRLVFSASGVSSLKKNLTKITIEDTTTVV